MQIETYNLNLNNNSNTAIVEPGSFEGRVVEQEELDVIEGRAVAALSRFYIIEMTTKEVLNREYSYPGKEAIPEGYQTPLQCLAQLNSEVFDLFYENPEFLNLYVKLFQTVPGKLLAGYENFKRLTHALNELNINVLKFFVYSENGYHQLNCLFQDLIICNLSPSIFNKLLESNHLSAFFTADSQFSWFSFMQNFLKLYTAQSKIASVVTDNIVTLFESDRLNEVVKLLNNERFAQVPREHLDSVLKDEACLDILTLASKYSIFLNALKNGTLLASEEAGLSPVAEQVLQIILQASESPDKDRIVLLEEFLFKDQIKDPKGNEICQNFQQFFELLQNQNLEVFNFLCENPPFLFQVLASFLPKHLRQGYLMPSSFQNLTEILLSLDLSSIKTSSPEDFRNGIFGILKRKTSNK